MNIGICIGTSHEAPEGSWFAPEMGGNRERPEAEQAAVCLTPMTGAEYSSVSRANHLKRSEKYSDALAAVEARMDAIKRSCLRTHVVALRNFYRPDGTSIDSIDELMRLIDAAPPAQRLILDDIFNALLDHSALEEGLLGESNAAPSS